jgi:predicted TPR repeat methyltransferase
VNRSPPPAVLQQLEAAKSEHRRGRLREARRRYKRILKQYPELTPALHFLGVLEHMDGNHEAGLALVRRAHARDPDDCDIRKNLSNILNDMNRCEEAEPLCRALVEQRPGDPGNHSNHSVALRKLGRFDEAIAAGRQAVLLAPDHAAGWHALANALSSAGALKEAVEAYEKVIAIEPAFSPAHNSLCRTLLQLEQAGVLSRFRLSRTRQAYRRWVQRVPDHPTAAFMLEVLEGGRMPERVPDAAVKASFDAYAADFDKHIRSLDYRGPERIAEVLARWLPAASADLDVLDGGCGTGLCSGMLRPYARTLSGVDLSPAMLKRAQATGRYDALTEAELGSFLDAHPKSFDVCAMADVLNYFGDLNAILSSAARALKPGGLLAFSVERSRHSGTRLHPTGRYSHHPGHVQSALTAAGLQGLELTEAMIRSEGNASVQGLFVCARSPAEMGPG